MMWGRSRQGARVLKDGGSLLTMIATERLPEVLAVMTPHLNYHWAIAYMMPTRWTSKPTKKVASRYKLVLWLTKGKYQGNQVGDAIWCVVSDKREKDADNWQQSIYGMGELLRRVAKEGDTVLDPFLGSGTTGIAALKLGMKFIGIEHREDKFELAKMRIHNAIHGIPDKPIGEKEEVPDAGSSSVADSSERKVA